MQLLLHGSSAVTVRCIVGPRFRSYKLIFTAIKAMSFCRCQLSVTVANRSLIVGLGIWLVVGLGLAQLIQSSFVDFPVNNISIPKIMTFTPKTARVVYC